MTSASQDRSYTVLGGEMGHGDIVRLDWHRFDDESAGNDGNPRSVGRNGGQKGVVVTGSAAEALAATVERQPRYQHDAHSRWIDPGSIGCRLLEAEPMTLTGPIGGMQREWAVCWSPGNRKPAIVPLHDRCDVHFVGKWQIEHHDSVTS